MIHETDIDIEKLREEFKNNKQPNFYYKNPLCNFPTGNPLEGDLFDIFLKIHLYISNLVYNK